jgi:hypothetical protein
VPYVRPRVDGKAASAASEYLAVRRSVDGGETFGAERTIADFSFGGARYTNIPSLAVDAAHGDRLYAAWLELDAAGNAGVMFSLSADKGSTWSGPVLLSEQREARRGADAPGPAYDAFLPTVAVNAAGVVGIAWYDTRATPGDRPGWEYRLRASIDGGRTWPPSARVSERRTTTRKRGAGHTGGLAAAADGAFHLLWVDDRTGLQQVWTARVTVGPG